ncbi:hypothetical protein AVEN_201861-1 [Araneus ventricosus]|uniref:Uncharacterized protein n=1 Tax=Araneus ventricosus TaxID=182803 RepID=A0A4Y2KNA4_ARAVE|nr:hypothetical protein AVEN_201861-1 [Araneus ventricosus]
MRFDISNVMYRENFPRFSQSACAQRCFFSVNAMQGNNIRKQIAFAELRSATSSDGSRRKKLLDGHVKWWVERKERYPLLSRMANLANGWLALLTCFHGPKVILHLLYD